MSLRHLLLLSALALGACGPNSNMVKQPKVLDGQADYQPAPDGTVARGTANDEATLAEPPPMTKELITRGQERYAINCAPCHGASGAGDGTIVQRGFPRPPSFHDERLRDEPTGYFVKVATQGIGVMYPQASRVTPADRWAIEAYIRALQLSRHVAASSLPVDLKDMLP